MAKRDTVERYLRCLCIELDLAQSASDPVPISKREFKRITRGTDNLIGFDGEIGCFTYETPANEQVKRMYPDAVAFFEEQLREL